MGRKKERETPLEGFVHALDPDLYRLLEKTRGKIQRELKRHRADLRRGDLSEITRALVEVYADTLREAVEMYEERILARLPPGIRGPIERLLRIQGR